jgi:SAM-dependent methyltransferase
MSHYSIEKDLFMFNKIVGREKRLVEKNPLKRIGYALFGEIHIPGRIRLNHIIKTVDELGLPKDRPIKVLDAGCGKGDMVFFLARKYPSWRITGLEIERDKYEKALIIKEKCSLSNVNFVHGNLLETDLDGEYDLVVCSDVLEHIEEDVSAMKVLNRLLKKGGCLVITVPSVPQRKHLKLVKMKEKKIGFDPSYFGHVREGYSVEDLCGKLRPLDFSEIAPLHTFGFFGTLAYDIFFLIGDNRPNLLVFTMLLPFFLTLAFFDVRVRNSTGSGLLVKAWKGGSD